MSETVLSSGVIVRDVLFKNREITMAGDLYLPANWVSTGSYSAIVVTHPGGGVKEQVAGHYADKLAEKGFVALAFDASYQGESGGEPRFLEDPYARVEDIRSAVDYLTTVPFVNKENIGALGICAGGGYTLNAAQTEKRIKAIATVSAVDIGGYLNGPLDALRENDIARITEAALLTLALYLIQ
jgi:fermentation-respiration switch protein FrsA (DUF1100 family)